MGKKSPERVYMGKRKHGGETKSEANSKEIQRLHQLSAHYSFGIVIVNEQGTVDVYGEQHKWKKCWKKGLVGWKDIIEISSSGRHAVGLKHDGEVVAFTGNPYHIDDDLHDYNAACEIDDWENIVQVACGLAHTVGLKSDGTVVAVGDNSHGQCMVEKWRDIVQVTAANYCTVGLKSDGMLVFAGDCYGREINRRELLGVTLVNIGADTYVVAIDENSKVISALSEIETVCHEWEEVVKIYTHFDTVIGVLNDGSLYWGSASYSSDGNIYGNKLVNLYANKL